MVGNDELLRRVATRRRKVMNQRREEIRLRQVEHGVEDEHPRFLEFDELVRVQLVNLRRFQELETVAADEDVTVRIDFEQISVQGVEPKTPAMNLEYVVSFHAMAFNHRVFDGNRFDFSDQADQA